MTGVPFIHVREANSDDAPTLARLWPDHPQLQLGRARVWLAEHGERIVACASARPQTLQLGPREHALAELWTSEVDPAYRSQGIDARLASALREALREAGVEALIQRGFGAPLLPHTPGFDLSCTRSYPMRAKVLRPLALLSKRGQWPALAVRAARPLDAVAGLPLRAPGWRPRKLASGSSLVELSLPEDAGAIADLRARSCPGRPRLHRSADALDEGLRELPGARCLGLTRTGVVIAYVAYRLQSAPNGLRVADLLDLAARDDDPALLAVLLRGVERRVRGEAELVRLLDALGDELSKVARLAGYLRQAEGYELALGPLDPEGTLPSTLRASASRWRLSRV